jgi:hypothetical protein
MRILCERFSGHAAKPKAFWAVLDRFTRAKKKQREGVQKK